MRIIVLSQPGCGPCRFVERTLERLGLDHEIRDVHADAEAEALLREVYAAYRPGAHPRTPVTLIDGRPHFGPDVRDALRTAA